MVEFLKFVGTRKVTDLLLVSQTMLSVSLIFACSSDVLGHPTKCLPESCFCRMISYVSLGIA